MENMKRLLEFAKPRTGKKITFYTKQYFVTSGGMVYDGNMKRFLTQRDIKGYMHVCLRDDEGKQHTTINVHNLVASCFVRLLEKGVNVHHISHAKSDNRLENLQIISASEHQRQHSFEKWTSGAMSGVKDNLRKIGIEANPPKPVAQLSLDWQLIRVYPSTAVCSRNGFDQGHVSACCRGERKTHKGYRWMYLFDYEAMKQKEERQKLETLASS